MPFVIREMHGAFSGTEGEVEYRVHFNPTNPGRPAQISGPPENCYPAESPEWEITLIEQAFYLPDQTEPTWVDIRKTGSPEEIAHVESWAENLDLSDEVVEDFEDQRAAAEEYRYEQRRDMTGFDD